MVCFDYYDNDLTILTNDIKNINSYFIENDYGFIMIRHVRCEKTNKYWKICYDSIRKYYNNLIVIIDDHTNYNYITNEKLINTLIINSNNQFNSGEYLTYYYYIKYKFFNKAIIFHDSMFINKFINFDNYENDFLWFFTKLHHNLPKEQNLISLLNNNEKLLDIHKNIKWNGCFGSCSVITFDFLQNIELKYNLSILINHIKKRLDRCFFERIIAIIFLNEKNNINNVCGNIFRYPNAFKYTYDNYIDDANNNNINKNLNIIKIWSGR
jgi:hypothetical protein